MSKRTSLSCPDRHTHTHTHRPNYCKPRSRMRRGLITIAHMQYIRMYIIPNTRAMHIACTIPAAYSRAATIRVSTKRMHAILSVKIEANYKKCTDLYVIHLTVGFACGEKGCSVCSSYILHSHGKTNSVLYAHAEDMHYVRKPWYMCSVPYCLDSSFIYR